MLVNMQAECASYSKAETQPKQVGEKLIISLRLQILRRAPSFMGPTPVTYEEFKFAYNTALGKRNRIVIK